MRTKRPEIGKGETCHSLCKKMAHTENTLSSFPHLLTFFPLQLSNWRGARRHQIPSHTHTHTSIKNKPSSTYSHPQHHLSITIATMPLEHVITHKAFREITNFIRNNGYDWGEFCHNTSRPSTTRKIMKTLPLSH